MFLRSQGVHLGYGGVRRRLLLQRSRAEIYQAGAENLKGFEHLAAENESAEV